MVGVGITILVRRREFLQVSSPASILYFKVEENLSSLEKRSFLKSVGSANSINWQELQPDQRNTWLTEHIQNDFEDFLPIGLKEGKNAHVETIKTIFRTYTNGVKTNRDNWVYDFDKKALVEKVNRLIDTFNAEIDRWKRAGQPEDVDSFVHYDDKQIKWSRDLKSDLRRKRYAQFQLSKIRSSLYRPFTKKFYFLDSVLSQDIFLHPKFFPNLFSEVENAVIVVSDHGFRSPFSTLAANVISDLHLLASTDAFQCFPYYTYNEDGSSRRENITDWALSQFQTKYGPGVTKWDIFHYIYALLHHPQYREHYAENLKRDLPHIPLLHSNEAFLASVSIGKQLMDSHLHYEQAKEYPLKWVENREVPFSWRVEKMKLTPDKTAVIVNESLTLSGIPQECFLYRLGNRSALEWVIDQYQVSEDKRSGIVSDPNNLDDEEYIVRLVGRVITVSVDTVRLVNELQQAVKMEDWMDDETEYPLDETKVEEVEHGS